MLNESLYYKTAENVTHLSLNYHISWCESVTISLLFTAWLYVFTGNWQKGRQD